MTKRYFTLLVLAVLSIAIAMMFYHAKQNHDGKGSSSITVVNASPGKNDNGLQRKQEATSYSAVTGWKVRPSSPERWKDEIIPSFVKIYVKRLRWVIDYGGKDEVWANSASTRLRILVAQIKHIKGVPDIKCGQRICEVHIATESGLSDLQKKAIIDKLAEPAYGPNEKRFFIVRQIFANTDIGEPQDGFFAYYQKRPT